MLNYLSLLFFPKVSYYLRNVFNAFHQSLEGLKVRRPWRELTAFYLCWFWSWIIYLVNSECVMNLIFSQCCVLIFSDGHFWSVWLDFEYNWSSFQKVFWRSVHQTPTNPESNSDLTQRKSLFVQNNSLTPDTSLHPHFLFLVTVLRSQQSYVSLKPSHIYITRTMAAGWFIFKSFWWVNLMDGCNLRKPDMCRKETFTSIPFQHENI